MLELMQKITSEMAKRPVRDISHEQISDSTSEQLLARLTELERRFRGFYPIDQLRELQGIKSELYCRFKGQPSRPWTTFVTTTEAMWSARP